MAAARKRCRSRRIPGPWRIRTFDTVLCLPGYKQGRARKKQRGSLQVMSWGTLPLDFQMQILSWLPAEDAMRLRGVCKDWALTLRDPRFLQMWAEQGGCRVDSFFLLHTWRADPNPTIFFRYRYPEVAPEGLFRLRSCIPENSSPILSAGGLVVCINEKWTWVGNPLTQQWVKVPPLEIVRELRTSGMLIPYTSEGRLFFKLWFEPYLFDSKVGIWMLPRYQTISMWAYNTVCIGGVCYGLGRFWEADAVVLLEIEDMLALSESRWVYAWDKQKAMKDIEPESAYMLEVNGEIGILAQEKTRLVILLLDRQNGWKWNKVSTLPTDIQLTEGRFCTPECCTYGKLTFMCVEEGVAIFDSESLTWTWLQVPPSENGSIRAYFAAWEPNAAAVPHLNTPSEELRQTCASKYHDGDFRKRFRLRLFSGLEALRKRGLSWQEIGRVVAADPSKGGEFVADVIPDGTEKNNFALKPGFMIEAVGLQPE